MYRSVPPVPPGRSDVNAIVSRSAVNDGSVSFDDVLTPGTGEAFYREASDPVDASADASWPPDWERLRGVAGRSESIELVGPPPFPAQGAAARSAS